MVTYSCEWQQGDKELAGNFPKSEGLGRKDAALNLGKTGGVSAL